jgi:hypothetical protein
MRESKLVARGVAPKHRPQFVVSNFSTLHTFRIGHFHFSFNNSEHLPPFTLWVVVFV